MSRFVKRYGQDLFKGILSQRIPGTNESEHYRHLHQEMDPVIDHVRETAQKVNDAPVSGNPNGHEYIGSIPTALLLDWLDEKGYTFDQYGRNDDVEGKGIGIEDEFKAWFLKNPDYNKFHAKTYQPRQKRIWTTTGN